MKCKACNATLSESDKFCPYCGTSIDIDEHNTNTDIFNERFVGEDKATYDSSLDTNDNSVEVTNTEVETPRVETKKSKLPLVLVICFVILAIVACVFIFTREKPEEKPVKTIELDQTEVESIRFTIGNETLGFIELPIDWFDLDSDDNQIVYGNNESSVSLKVEDSELDLVSYVNSYYNNHIVEGINMQSTVIAGYNGYIVSYNVDNINTYAYFFSKEAGKINMIVFEGPTLIEDIINSYSLTNE